jgi:hypothetical protein
MARAVLLPGVVMCWSPSVPFKPYALALPVAVDSPESTALAGPAAPPFSARGGSGEAGEGPGRRSA